jgi:hypothetical protein
MGYFVLYLPWYMHAMILVCNYMNSALGGAMYVSYCSEWMACRSLYERMTCLVLCAWGMTYPVYRWHSWDCSYE